MSAFITSRRSLIAIAGAGLVAAACQPSGGAGGVSPGDMVMGPATAKVTMIEYASATCPHCAAFHAEVWDKLKTNYIDTGKIRFIFREFPTAPEEVAVAGFQIARCNGADAEKYFSVLGVIFEQQPAIFQSLETGSVREKLLEIAKSAGLSEEQFTQCVSDPEGVKRIQATVDAARKQFKIDGTPALILNGEKLNIEQGGYTYERISKAIDAKLAAS